MRTHDMTKMVRANIRFEASVYSRLKRLCRMSGLTIQDGTNLIIKSAVRSVPEEQAAVDGLPLAMMTKPIQRLDERPDWPPVKAAPAPAPPPSAPQWEGDHPRYDEFNEWSSVRASMGIRTFPDFWEWLRDIAEPLPRSYEIPQETSPETVDTPDWQKL